REANFGERRRDDGLHTGKLRGCIGVELRDTSVRVRAAKHARVKHSGQPLIVSVFRNTSRFQWSINTGDAVIEQLVFVVWSPAWAGVLVDFNLDHLLDAVDDARHADLLFGLG